ncbi:uncharacterized protein LOC119658174 [Hermetia illucens]|uniref:uncharacterized protein LOC119658174 n=1 Tax=Hermetia illucens TaxID=343691 RepID=UPI0018CC535B|nr:uncharacterized protein LOC119658174 [Hermetia illucens]
MERQGIIRKSNSRYASPIVVVAKKLDNSGRQKFRLFVDYRKLNEITVDDKYPLSNIDSILDKLGRVQYFTSIDLAKGYHQIKMNPNDIPKIAFVTPCGLYEYLRMPFGLKNAPATFQRLMNNILRDYINKICVVYLDDILVFSTSLQEHIQSLTLIFKKLSQHNLKLQVDKCSFLKRNTEFLGHVLTSEEPSQILHMDVYFFSKQPFLTLIDKLSKKAYVYHLPNRNWTKKVEALEEHFSKFGKPQKLVAENEFKAENFKEFLREQNVDLHLTKPNTHTGNNDINRFHSTIQEKFVAMRKLDLTIVQKLHRPVQNYNNRFHSTIKMTPEEAMLTDPVKLRERILAFKEKIIAKLNESREEYKEIRNTIPVKNHKRNHYKNEPRYRLKEMQGEHPSNIKRPRKFSDDDISISHTDPAGTSTNSSIVNSESNHNH